MISVSKRAIVLKSVLNTFPRETHLAILALSLATASATLSACGGAEQASQSSTFESDHSKIVEQVESEDSLNIQSLVSNSSILRNAANPDKAEWFVPASLQKEVAKFKEMIVSTPAGNRKLTVRVSNEQALFDGDIVVNDPTEESAGGTTESFGRSTAGYLWPNATMPYSIDARTPASTRQKILEAVNHWNTKTKLRLVPRSSERDFVTFRDGVGCSSNVGRTGGQQFVSLASACGIGNAIHEIGHAWGLWHEQSRTDRDTVVTVYWQNVDPAFKGNFQIEQNGSALLTAYDINSIMQYGSTAFARTGSTGRPVGPTMLLKNGKSFEAQRTALSAQDIAGVQKMYGF